MKLLRWLSPEASAAESPGDATAIAVNDLVGKAVGSDALPRLASAVGVATGYWSRAFAAALVEPEPLAEVIPALVVRLALEGEAALVRDGSRLALATISSVKGRSAPETWVYQLTLPGPSETPSIVRSRAEVAHIRLGPREHWRGEAPWATVPYAANTVARFERLLQEVDGLPHRSGVGISFRALLNDQQLEGIHRLLSKAAEDTTRPLIMPGGATFTNLASGGATGSPAHFPMAGAIFAAYGIPPVLFSDNASDAALREAKREFVSSTIVPIAAQIVREVKRLDPSASIDLSPLRMPDWQQLSRAYKSFRDAGMSDEEARRLLGLE